KCANARLTRVFKIGLRLQWTRHKVASRPGRWRKALNAAWRHVVRKIVPQNANPFLIRNPAWVAGDFKLKMAQDWAGADEMVRAVVHRDHEQVHAPDAFMKDAA